MRLKSLDRLEVTLLLCLITSERRSFRALKMRPCDRMPFFALSKMHSVGRRLFSAPLKMRCVPEKTVFGTEYLFRTVEACFLHQMLPKMRRVPQEAFLSTARIFGTGEGSFWYRILQMPEKRRAFIASLGTLCVTKCHYLSFGKCFDITEACRQR